MKFTKKGSLVDKTNLARKVKENFNSEFSEIAHEHDGTIRLFGKRYTSDATLEKMNDQHLGRYLHPKKQSTPIGNLEQLEKGRMIQPFRAFWNYIGEGQGLQFNKNLSECPHLLPRKTRVINVKFMMNSVRNNDGSESPHNHIIGIGGQYYSPNNEYLSVQANGTNMVLYYGIGNNTNFGVFLPYPKDLNEWHEYEFNLDRLDNNNCWASIDGVKRHLDIPSPFETGELYDLDMSTATRQEFDLLEMQSQASYRGLYGGICNLEIMYDGDVVGSWGFNEDQSHARATNTTVRFWDNSKYGLHIDHTPIADTNTADFGDADITIISNSVISWRDSLVRKSWHNTRGYTKAYVPRRELGYGLNNGTIPPTADWYYEFDFKIYGSDVSDRLLSNVYTDANQNYIRIRAQRNDTGITGERELQFEVNDNGTKKYASIPILIKKNVWYHLKLMRVGDRFTLELDGQSAFVDVSTGLSLSANQFRLAGIYGTSKIMFKNINTDNQNSINIFEEILPVFNYYNKPVQLTWKDFGVQKENYTNWGEFNLDALILGYASLQEGQSVTFVNDGYSEILLTGPFVGNFSKWVPESNGTWRTGCYLTADYSSDPTPAVLKDVEIYMFENAKSPLNGDYVGNIFRREPYDLSDLGKEVPSGVDVENEGYWNIVEPSYIASAENQSHYDLAVGEGLYVKGEGVKYHAGGYIISKMQRYGWDGWAVSFGTNVLHFVVKCTEGNTNTRTNIYLNYGIDPNSEIDFEFYIDPVLGLTLAIVNGVDVLSNFSNTLWDPTASPSTPENLMIGRIHTLASYTGMFKRIQFGKSSSNILLDTDNDSHIVPINVSSAGLPYKKLNSYNDAVLKQDYVLSINGPIGGGTGTHAITNQELSIDTKHNDYLYEWWMKTDVDHTGGSYKIIFNTHKTNHNSGGTGVGIEVQHHFSSVFRVKRIGGANQNDYKAFNFFITDAQMRGVHHFKVLETHYDNGDARIRLWMNGVEISLLNTTEVGTYVEQDYKFDDHKIMFWGDGTWGSWGGTDTSIWDFKIHRNNELIHYFPMTGYPSGDKFDDVVGTLKGSVLNGNVNTNFLLRNDSNFYFAHRGYNKYLHYPSMLANIGKSLGGSVTDIWKVRITWDIRDSVSGGQWSFELGTSVTNEGKLVLGYQKDNNNQKTPLIRIYNPSLTYSRYEKVYGPNSGKGFFTWEIESDGTNLRYKMYLNGRLMPYNGIEGDYNTPLITAKTFNTDVIRINGERYISELYIESDGNVLIDLSKQDRLKNIEWYDTSALGSYYNIPARVEADGKDIYGKSLEFKPETLNQDNIQIEFPDIPEVNTALSNKRNYSPTESLPNPLFYKDENGVPGEMLLYTQEQLANNRKNNYRFGYLETEEPYVFKVGAEDTYMRSTKNFFADGEKFTIYCKFVDITSAHRYFLCGTMSDDSFAVGLKINNADITWVDLVGDVSVDILQTVVADTWYRFDTEVTATNILIKVNGVERLNIAKSANFPSIDYTVIGLRDINAISTKSLQVGMEFIVPDVPKRFLTSKEDNSMRRMDFVTPKGIAKHHIVKGNYRSHNDMDFVGFAMGSGSGLRLLTKSEVRNGPVTNKLNHIDIGRYVGYNTDLLLTNSVFSEDLSYGVLLIRDYTRTKIFLLVCNNILKENREFDVVEWDYYTESDNITAWVDTYNGAYGFFVMESRDPRTVAPFSGLHFIERASSYLIENRISIHYTDVENLLRTNKSFPSFNTTSHWNGWLCWISDTKEAVLKKIGENKWIKVESLDSDFFINDVVIKNDELYRVCGVQGTPTKQYLLNASGLSSVMTLINGQEVRKYIIKDTTVDDVFTSGVSIIGEVNLNARWHTQGSLVGENQMATRNPDALHDYTDPANPVTTAGEGHNMYQAYNYRTISLSKNGYIGNFGSTYNSVGVDCIHTYGSDGGYEYFSAFTEKNDHTGKLFSFLEDDYKKISYDEETGLLTHYNKQTKSNQIHNISSLFGYVANIDLPMNGLHVVLYRFGNSTRIMDFSTGVMRWSNADMSTIGVVGESPVEIFIDELNDKMYCINYNTSTDHYQFIEADINYITNSITLVNATDVIDMSSGLGYGYQYMTYSYRASIAKDSLGKIHAVIMRQGNPSGNTVTNPKVWVKDPDSLTFKVIMDSNFSPSQYTSSNTLQKMEAVWMKNYDQMYLIDGAITNPNNCYKIQYSNTINQDTYITNDNIDSDVILYTSKCIDYKNNRIGGLYGYNDNSSRSGVWEFVDSNTLSRIKTFGRVSKIVHEYGYSERSGVPFFYKGFIYGSSRGGNIYRFFIDDENFEPPGKLIIEYEYGDTIEKYLPKGIDGEYYEVVGTLTKEKKV